MNLESATTNLVSLGHAPIIGVEYECYFASGDMHKDMLIFGEFIRATDDLEIPRHNIEPEVGYRQYEISLKPVEPVAAVEYYLKTRELLEECADKYDTQILFEPKPFDNQPGCGLHLHLGLYDENGKSCFAKEKDVEENIITQQVIAGMCAKMLEDFAVFAPTEDCYKRYSTEINEDAPEDQPMQRYNNAPVNVSWGANNRTTAIRIPTSTLDAESRHIEHRVCSIKADIEQAIVKLLESAYFGIVNELKPPSKIYGNAYDKQYDCPAFPASLEEAINESNNS